MTRGSKFLIRLGLPILRAGPAGDCLLVHSHGHGVSKFSFYDKSFVECHEHHQVPELLRSPSVEIVGSGNGLICFSRGTAKSVHSFLIWNPSIRKLVELPLRNFSHSYENLLGFGFDSGSRDYKIVRVVYRTTHESTDNNVVVAECDIFNVTKGGWRNSNSPTLMRPCYYNNHPSLCLHGNLHWFGYDDTFRKYTLASFNLSSEVLHEIEIVPDAAKTYGSDTEVMPINGLLSLTVVKTEQHSIPVWSMKEYGVTESWTKLFNIELPYTMKPVTLLRVLENGEVLLLERVMGNKDVCNVLVLYNYESKKSKTLLSMNEHLLHRLRACFYKESLVLL